MSPVSVSDNNRSGDNIHARPFSPAVLTDGTIVELVPMSPDDAARLVRFHSTLSPDTTHDRFFAFHPELSEHELTRFTHVDHRDREAILAVHDGEIAGVARFDRTSPCGDEAEPAFVVTDAWQGLGLGTVLFDRLAARAVELGVRRFVPDTLGSNHRMLALFHHRELPITERIDHGVVRLTIELTDPQVATTS